MNEFEEALVWFDNQVYVYRRHLSIHSCIPNSDAPWYEVREWNTESQTDVCIGDGFTILDTINDARSKTSNVPRD